MDQNIPPETPHEVSLRDEVDEHLIALFAQAKRGPRPERKSGTTDQESDYASKLRVFKLDYERLCTAALREEARGREEPAPEPAILTVAALGGPRVDWVITQRRDPRTGLPLRPASRNAYRRIVSSFVGWLHTDCVLDGPLAFGGHLEREDGEAEPVVFTRDELAKILRVLAANDTITYRRCTAMLLLGLDAGPRSGEMCRVTVLELDRVRSQVGIDGKFGKGRTIPVSPKTWLAIDRYLAVRRGNLGHLFVTDDGSASLDPRVFRAQFERVLRKAGIKRDVPVFADLGDRPRVPAGKSPQALRRTLAGAYGRSGRTEEELGALMGWSPKYAHEVVERYRRVSPDDLSDVHSASSGLRLLDAA